MTETTLVIPQYNSAALTRELLESLFLHEPSLGTIVVIDDGSWHEGELLEQSVRRNRFQFLRQAHAGLTVAWNRALATVTTPYVIVLNNDVLAHGPAIDRLVEPLRQSQAKIVGAGWREERDWPPLKRQTIPRQRVLQGWCLAFSMPTWRELGGFDESLQLYFSDTDFQLQALTQPGITSPALHAVEVPWEHLGHRTLHQMPEHRAQWQRDRRRFWEKWS